MGDMDGSSSSNLRIWEGWTTTLAHQSPVRPLPGERVLAGPHWPATFAERLAAREMLRLPNWLAESVEPLTLQWFLQIENVRHGRQGKWLPHLLEFTKHGGETLLGLGLGLGTDWVQYARHGASVIACCPSSEQLALIRRNFELRGLSASAYLHASPTALPLETASIDVACVTEALHKSDDPAAVVEEVYRVLKPGGKVLVIVPAHYDIGFWGRCCLPWHPRFRAPGPGEEEQDLIASPADARFSGRSLRRLFSRFSEPHVSKRHLRRADVPHVWRWVPLPLMERLMGRFLVFKAFKPLSAAIAEQLAA
jgi:SAM-dependent methyltransferase